MDAQGCELFLAVGAYLVQEDVAEEEMRDPLFEEMPRGGVHRLPVGDHRAFRGKFHFEQGNADALGLSFEQRLGNVVHRRLPGAPVNGGEQRHDVVTPFLQHLRQGQCRVFPAAPVEYRFFFHRFALFSVFRHRLFRCRACLVMRWSVQSGASEYWNIRRLNCPTMASTWSKISDWICSYRTHSCWAEKQ